VPLNPDRARWQERYAADLDAGRRSPSSWVVERCGALPAGALVADVAAGAGRHAIALAEQGSRVVAVDFVESAVAAARRGHPRVLAAVADAAALPFAPGTFDAVLTVNFLDRALFQTFVALVRPGGWLVVETYTREHLALVASGRARRPRDPAYTLEPGELPRLVAPLTVLAYREGLVRDDAGERCVASVVAVKGEEP
jgi:SAM-dependent methyltransferase